MITISMIKYYTITWSLIIEGAGRPCWIIEGASGSPGSYSTEEELGSCILVTLCN